MNEQLNFPLLETTIEQLQAKMATGELTARAIVEQYLARIAALDEQTVNAVLELNPDALAIADALDAERAQTGPRGPLHGIPIMLKANIDTADKMTTTAGSLALAGSIPPQDAFVAQKLREAGAILLGKTNLSEWANFRSSRSISGWSGQGGQTRNAYVLDRNPSGSSSGSGAAVSANFCVAALGTETDGSIVSPSNQNGLVGLKPTLGLVSRSGIIPIAHSQDSAGPMTRTVRDAAVLLGALAGGDPRDPLSEAVAPHAHADYTQFLTDERLDGVRLGVAKQFLGRHPRVGELLETAVSNLKQLGAEIIDIQLDLPKEIEDHEITVLLYEFKADLNAYLATLGEHAPIKSMAELHAFNEAHAAEEMPYFGQEIVTLALEKGDLNEEAYLTALREGKRMAGKDGIDAALAEHKLDAIISATGGPAWLIDPVNGDSYIGSGSCSQPAAVAGYPHITLPMGQIMELPIGLSFFAGAFSEPTLLRLAYAFEQATQARRAPRFLKTAVI